MRSYLQTHIIFFIVSFLLIGNLTADEGQISNKNTSNKSDQELFNFGHSATHEEIQKWDLDVRPDGTGLPKGKGTVQAGKTLYATKCAFCHGANGEGGLNDRLVARPGEIFPQGDSACGFECRTIGNYWPYATTLYDYILRSMPMNAPGSLAFDEVYSISAYLLYLNDIISEDVELTAITLKEIIMPAHDKFITDDRLDYNVVH